MITVTTSVHFTTTRAGRKRMHASAEPVTWTRTELEAGSTSDRGVPSADTQTCASSTASTSYKPTP